MARRKTHKTPAKHTRRRKIGAIGGSDQLSTFAGALGGYVVGNIVTAKLFPTMDVKIKGAVVAAAGILLVPKIGGNSPLMKGLGVGIGVAGGAAILKSLGVISGTAAVLPLYTVPALNGRGNGTTNALSGGGVSSMVSGRVNVGGGVNSMVNGRMTTRQSGLMQG
jgi:hypothetical protein